MKPVGEGSEVVRGRDVGNTNRWAEKEDIQEMTQARGQSRVHCQTKKVIKKNREPFTRADDLQGKGNRVGDGLN